MTADRLREAARVLRERAEGASDVPGPWWSVIHADGRARVFLANGDNLPMHGYPDFAAYIATMHPGVGVAVAEWLEWTSILVENDDTLGRVTLKKAMSVADLILGAES